MARVLRRAVRAARKAARGIPSLPQGGGGGGGGGNWLTPGRRAQALGNIARMAALNRARPHNTSLHPRGPGGRFVQAPDLPERGWAGQPGGGGGRMTRPMPGAPPMAPGMAPGVGGAGAPGSPQQMARGAARLGQRSGRTNIDLAGYQPSFVTDPADPTGETQRWTMSTRARNTVDGIISKFTPAGGRNGFATQDTAREYLSRQAKSPKRKLTPDQEKAVSSFTSYDGYDRVQRALQDDSVDLSKKVYVPEGADEAVPVPDEIRHLDSAMKPLDDDLILNFTTTPRAFGLNDDEIDDLGPAWEGRLASDSGYMYTNVGRFTPTPELDAAGGSGPKVKVSILAPKGTKAIIPGGKKNARGEWEEGSDAVILDREMPTRITRVDTDPLTGDKTVWAVATPRSIGGKEAPVGRRQTPQDFRRALQGRQALEDRAAAAEGREPRKVARPRRLTQEVTEPEEVQLTDEQRDALGAGSAERSLEQLRDDGVINAAEYKKLKRFDNLAESQSANRAEEEAAARTVAAKRTKKVAKKTAKAVAARQATGTAARTQAQEARQAVLKARGRRKVPDNIKTGNYVERKMPDGTVAIGRIIRVDDDGLATVQWRLRPGPGTRLPRTEPNLDLTDKNTYGTIGTRTLRSWDADTRTYTSRVTNQPRTRKAPGERAIEDLQVSDLERQGEAVTTTQRLTTEAELAKAPTLHAGTDISPRAGHGIYEIADRETPHRLDTVLTAKEVIQGPEGKGGRATALDVVRRGTVLAKDTKTGDITVEWENADGTKTQERLTPEAFNDLSRFRFATAAQKARADAISERERENAKLRTRARDRNPGNLQPEDRVSQQNEQVLNDLEKDVVALPDRVSEALRRVVRSDTIQEMGPDGKPTRRTITLARTAGREDEIRAIDRIITEGNAYRDRVRRVIDELRKGQEALRARRVAPRTPHKTGSRAALRTSANERIKFISSTEDGQGPQAYLERMRSEGVKSWDELLDLRGRREPYAALARALNLNVDNKRGPNFIGQTRDTIASAIRNSLLEERLAGAPTRPAVKTTPPRVVRAPQAPVAPTKAVPAKAVAKKSTPPVIIAPMRELGEVAKPSARALEGAPAKTTPRKLAKAAPTPAPADMATQLRNAESSEASRRLLDGLSPRLKAPYQTLARELDVPFTPATTRAQLIDRIHAKVTGARPTVAKVTPTKVVAKAAKAAVPTKAAPPKAATAKAAKAAVKAAPTKVTKAAPAKAAKAAPVKVAKAAPARVVQRPAQPSDLRVRAAEAGLPPGRDALRALAKKRGHKGYSNLSMDGLRELLLGDGQGRPMPGAPPEVPGRKVRGPVKLAKKTAPAKVAPEAQQRPRVTRVPDRYQGVPREASQAAVDARTAEWDQLARSADVHDRQGRFATPAMRTLEGQRIVDDIRRQFLSGDSAYTNERLAGFIDNDLPLVRAAIRTTPVTQRDKDGIDVRLYDLAKLRDLARRLRGQETEQQEIERTRTRRLVRRTDALISKYSGRSREQIAESASVEDLMDLQKDETARTRLGISNNAVRAALAAKRIEAPAPTARPTVTRAAAKAVSAPAKAAVPERGPRRGNRRPAPALNAVSVYMNDGEDSLRRQLRDLDTEQLKDIIADEGMDPARRLVRSTDNQKLTDWIVSRAHDRSVKGDAFRPPRTPEFRETPAKTVPVKAVAKATPAAKVTRAPAKAPATTPAPTRLGDEIAALSDAQVRARAKAVGIPDTKPAILRQLEANNVSRHQIDLAKTWPVGRVRRWLLGQDTSAMDTTPGPRPRVTRAAAVARSTDDIATDLRKVTTEADGDRILDELGTARKKPYQDLARALDVEFRDRDTIPQLRDAIKRQVVTRRLEHDAYLRNARPAALEVPGTTPETPGTRPRVTRAAAAARPTTDVARDLGVASSNDEVDRIIDGMGSRKLPYHQLMDSQRLPYKSTDTVAKLRENLKTFYRTKGLEQAATPEPTAVRTVTRPLVTGARQSIEDMAKRAGITDLTPRQKTAIGKLSPGEQRLYFAHRAPTAAGRMTHTDALNRVQMRTPGISTPDALPKTRALKKTPSAQKIEPQTDTARAVKRATRASDASSTDTARQVARAQEAPAGFVPGRLSTKPLRSNEEYGADPETVHPDGAIRHILNLPEDQARLDVGDGESLHNRVLGWAVDARRGRISTRQLLDNLNQVEDRVPFGSEAHRAINQMRQDMLGGRAGLSKGPIFRPRMPVRVPQALRQLVDDFFNNPLTQRHRRDANDMTDLQRAVDLVSRWDRGEVSPLRMGEELRKLGRTRHESLEGWYEKDRSIKKAAASLDQALKGRRTNPGAYDEWVAKPGVSLAAPAMDPRIIQAPLPRDMREGLARIRNRPSNAWGTPDSLRIPATTLRSLSRRGLVEELDDIQGNKWYRATESPTVTPFSSSFTRISRTSDGKLTGTVGAPADIARIVNVDTGENGTPIKDVSIRYHGTDVRVGNGTLFRENGKTFLVEHADTEAGHAFARAWRDSFRGYEQESSPITRESVKGWAVLSSRSPLEAVVHQHQPGRSEKTIPAQADEGGVNTVWANGQFFFNRPDVIRYNLRHEGAHQLSWHLGRPFGRGGQVSQSKEYQDAVRVQRVSPFTEFRPNNSHVSQRFAQAMRDWDQDHGPGARVPQGATPYGRMSFEESFAEDVALYMEGALGVGTLPDGSRRPAFFRDFFPERTAFLDGYMPDVQRRQLAAINGRSRRVAATQPLAAPPVRPTAARVSKAAPAPTPITAPGTRATTPNQDKALAGLRDRGDWSSSADLGVHHATMTSLVKRGNVEERTGPDGRKQYRLPGTAEAPQARPTVKRAPAAKKTTPAKAVASATKETTPAKKTAKATRQPRYPFRARVQETYGRQDRFFETREEFDEFMRENDRYVTNYTTPDDYPSGEAWKTTAPAKVATTAKKVAPARVAAPTKKAAPAKAAKTAPRKVAPQTRGPIPPVQDQAPEPASTTPPPPPSARGMDLFAKGPEPVTTGVRIPAKVTRANTVTRQTQARRAKAIEAMGGTEQPTGIPEGFRTKRRPGETEEAHRIREARTVKVKPAPSTMRQRITKEVDDIVDMQAATLFDRQERLDVAEADAARIAADVVPNGGKAISRAHSSALDKILKSDYVKQAGGPNKVGTFRAADVDVDRDTLDGLVAHGLLNLDNDGGFRIKVGKNGRFKPRKTYPKVTEEQAREISDRIARSRFNEDEVESRKLAREIIDAALVGDEETGPGLLKGVAAQRYARLVADDPDAPPITPAEEKLLRDALAKVRGRREQALGRIISRMRPRVTKEQRSKLIARGERMLDIDDRLDRMDLPPQDQENLELELDSLRRERNAGRSLVELLGFERDRVRERIDSKSGPTQKLQAKLKDLDARIDRARQAEEQADAPDAAKIEASERRHAARMDRARDRRMAEYARRGFPPVPPERQKMAEAALTRGFITDNKIDGEPGNAEYRRIASAIRGGMSPALAQKEALAASEKWESRIQALEQAGLLKGSFTPEEVRRHATMRNIVQGYRDLHTRLGASQLPDMTPERLERMLLPSDRRTRPMGQAGLDRIDVGDTVFLGRGRYGTVSDITDGQATINRIGAKRPVKAAVTDIALVRKGNKAQDVDDLVRRMRMPRQLAVAEADRVDKEARAVFRWKAKEVSAGRLLQTKQGDSLSRLVEPVPSSSKGDRITWTHELPDGSRITRTGVVEEEGPRPNDAYHRNYWVSPDEVIDGQDFEGRTLVRQTGKADFDSSDVPGSETARLIDDVSRAKDTGPVRTPEEMEALSQSIPATRRRGFEPDPKDVRAFNRIVKKITGHDTWEDAVRDREALKKIWDAEDASPDLFDMAELAGAGRKVFFAPDLAGPAPKITRVGLTPTVPTKKVTKAAAKAAPAKTAAPAKRTVKAAKKTAPAVQAAEAQEMVRRPFPQSPSDAPSRIKHLDSINTREQATDAVAGLDTPSLRDIARELRIPGAARMNVPDLRKAIVEGTVGRRLDSIATKGFSGSSPARPGLPADEFFDVTRREAGLPAIARSARPTLKPIVKAAKAAPAKVAKAAPAKVAKAAPAKVAKAAPAKVAKAAPAKVAKAAPATSNKWQPVDQLKGLKVGDTVEWREAAPSPTQRSATGTRSRIREIGPDGTLRLENGDTVRPWSGVARRIATPRAVARPAKSTAPIPTTPTTRPLRAAQLKHGDEVVTTEPDTGEQITGRIRKVVGPSGKFTRTFIDWSNGRQEYVRTGSPLTGVTRVGGSSAIDIKKLTADNNIEVSPTVLTRMQRYLDDGSSPSSVATALRKMALDKGNKFFEKYRGPLTDEEEFRKLTARGRRQLDATRAEIRNLTDLSDLLDESSVATPTTRSTVPSGLARAISNIPPTPDAINPPPRGRRVTPERSPDPGIPDIIDLDRLPGEERDEDEDRGRESAARRWLRRLLHRDDDDRNNKNLLNINGPNGRRRRRDRDRNRDDRGRIPGGGMDWLDGVPGGLPFLPNGPGGGGSDTGAGGAGSDTEEAKGVRAAVARLLRRLSTNGDTSLPRGRATTPTSFVEPGLYPRPTSPIPGTGPRPTPVRSPIPRSGSGIGPGEGLFTAPGSGSGPRRVGRSLSPDLESLLDSLTYDNADTIRGQLIDANLSDAEINALARRSGVGSSLTGTRGRMGRIRRLAAALNASRSGTDSGSEMPSLAAPPTGGRRMITRGANRMPLPVADVAPADEENLAELEQAQQRARRRVRSASATGRSGPRAAALQERLDEVDAQVAEAQTRIDPNPNAWRQRALRQELVDSGLSEADAIQATGTEPESVPMGTIRLPQATVGRPLRIRRPLPTEEVVPSPMELLEPAPQQGTRTILQRVSPAGSIRGIQDPEGEDRLRVLEEPGSGGARADTSGGDARSGPAARRAQQDEEEAGRSGAELPAETRGFQAPPSGGRGVPAPATGSGSSSGGGNVAPDGGGGGGAVLLSAADIRDTLSKMQTPDDARNFLMSLHISNSGLRALAESFDVPADQSASTPALIEAIVSAVTSTS